MKDILEFIEKQKPTLKRSTFDIDYLEEWLDYLNKNGFLHIHRVNGEIRGIISVFPIGKHKRPPSMAKVIECMQLVGWKDTDYFVMDALVSDEESRKTLVKRLLKIYPDAESNPDCQIYAQRGDKIIKFNKQILLTFIK